METSQTPAPGQYNSEQFCKKYRKGFSFAHSKRGFNYKKVQAVVEWDNKF